MEYTLKIPAMAGDVIPLFIVADAMARLGASGYGTLPLHGPTLKEHRQRCSARLVTAAKNGMLIVCDSEGETTSANALIDAANFPTEPSIECIAIPSEKPVFQLSEIDVLFVKHQQLNNWGQKNGDAFHVHDWPVEVVEFGPQDEHGVFAYRGAVSLPVAAEPARSARTREAVPDVVVVAAETKEQRQDRRLKLCEDAGLTFNKAALLRLPDGVGSVADSEGITRQAFSTDVKAALKRREAAIKEGEIIRLA